MHGLVKYCRKLYPRNHIICNQMVDMDELVLEDVNLLHLDIPLIQRLCESQRSTSEVASRPESEAPANKLKRQKRYKSSLLIADNNYKEINESFHKEINDDDETLIKYRSYNEIVSRRIHLKTLLTFKLPDLSTSNFVCTSPNTYEFTTNHISFNFPKGNLVLGVKNSRVYKMKDQMIASFHSENKTTIDQIRKETSLLKLVGTKSNFTVEALPPFGKFIFDTQENSLELVLEFQVHYGCYMNELVPTIITSKVKNILNEQVKPYPITTSLSEDPYTPVNAQLFYKAMSDNALQRNFPTGPIDLPELETNLLRFQNKTVHWLLQKELVNYDYRTNRTVSKELISLQFVQKLQAGETGDHIDEEIYSILNSLSFGWERVHFRSHKYWYNKYIGNLLKEQVVRQFVVNYHRDSTTTKQLPGQGLLAEEMGLGKTVEVAALVLLNPRPIEQVDGIINLQLKAYGDLKSVLQAKTTLIIAPDSILRQWVDEILRLAPSLAITVYKGLDKYPKLEGNPRLIADYLRMFDVVFTTYSTIARELDYALYSSRNKLTRSSVRQKRSHYTDTGDDLDNEDSEDSETRNDPRPPPSVDDQETLLREYRAMFQLSMQDKKPKIANLRSEEHQQETDFEKALQDEIHLAMAHNKLPDIYHNPGYQSPLMLLQFWRVILDEVQMVSSKISRPFQSAALIPRYHSWGVSGTPIKKDLNDLHSVLEFLRYQPFCGKIGKVCWELLTNINVNSNQDFIKLWKAIGFRHTKAMVHDDIKLPPQNRVLMTIPFNAVEQENYNQVLEQCLSSICLDVHGNPVIDNWEPTPTILAYMRTWLVKLRQLCCNPQVGKLNLSTRRHKARRHMYNAGRGVARVNALKTLDNVLDDMIDNAVGDILKAERSAVLNYIDYAQKCEFHYFPSAAVTIFERASLIIQEIIARGKHMLRTSLNKRNSFMKDVKIDILDTDILHDDNDEDETYLLNEISSLSDKDLDQFNRLDEFVKSTKARLRFWNLMLHKCYFLMASGFFQLYDEEYLQTIEREKDPLLVHYIRPEAFTGSSGYNVVNTSTLLIGGELTNTEFVSKESVLKNFVYDTTNEESEFVQQTKFLENTYYAMADSIRQNILQASIKNVQKSVTARIENRDSFISSEKFLDDGTILLPKSTKKLFHKFPIIVIDELKETVIGMRVKLYFQRVEALVEQLNTQANLINDWMSNLLEILSSPLLNSEQNPSGEEYEKSIEDQDKASCYFHLLSVLLADRSQVIEGKVNSTKITIITKAQEAKDFEAELEKINNKDFLVQLRKDRNLYKPVSKYSLNDLVLEIKQLETKLDDDKSAGSTSVVYELDALEGISKSLRNIYENQKLSHVLIQKELSNNLNAVFNARIDYFKQLQQISDSVRKSEQQEVSQLAIDGSFRKCLHEVNLLPSEMGKLITKFKYLKTLTNMNSSIKEDEGKKVIDNDSLVCIICTSTITVGSLTPCGHKYCKECLEHWLNLHKTCPMCKSHITLSTVYNFTHYIPDLKANAVSTTVKEKKDEHLFSIYNDVDDIIVSDIQKIKIKHSYSSKVDMIVKQVLYLKLKDPNVQIIVFSQWQDLLYILATAFKDSGISFLASYGTLTAELGVGRPRSKYDSVERFKNPENGITCFLLNAKAQASGLTLINATHIFLCEPLVNTSLELQAISRIHRIGQTKVTTVWMFAIENTVEESIVILSTNKRLEYINKESKLEQKAEAKDLSTAESMTLMKSGGIDTMVNRGSGEGETVSNDDLWDAFFCARASKEMRQTMNIDNMSKIV